MTDSEKSSEGFLERWSRKKIEAEREAPEADGSQDATAATPPHDAVLSEHRDQGATAASARPEFDLASLPSLDSITAATDIRPFLAPGVPRDLARAALRRAWSTDPAIRDFVGLAENAWDFTAPDAMAGFGPLPPGYDVKRLVAQLFGEDDKVIAPRPPASDPALSSASQSTTNLGDKIAAPDVVSPSQDDRSEGATTNSATEETTTAPLDDALLQCEENNIAPHNSISDNDPGDRKNRRQHGGALPQ